MPFFHTQSRSELRQMYVDAWRKRREKLPVEPVEAQIADVVQDHPEYHSALEQGEQVLDKDFQPEAGATNPFLHMGLHLAVRDQVATDRPPGIKAAFASLVAKHPSAHDAEHVLLELLAEALWNAQRSGQAPDERAYLGRVREKCR
ncbi:MAG: hypothetical protein RLZZ403_491 [Pseudomonadota bacterium]|jgi:hypothetical protein